MSLAEGLLFAVLVCGVYFLLTPIRARMERQLLRWMGRESHRKGQGPVFTIHREKD
jgi:hypothetical protein